MGRAMAWRGRTAAAQSFSGWLLSPGRDGGVKCLLISVKGLASCAARTTVQPFSPVQTPDGPAAPGYPVVQYM